MSNWFTEEQRNNAVKNGINLEDITKNLLANWDMKRPIWVTIFLETLTKSYIQSVENPSLDAFLAQVAIKSGKNVGAIETAQEQCEMLNHLNNTLVSFQRP